jgi:hypothetical protein
MATIRDKVGHLEALLIDLLYVHLDRLSVSYKVVTSVCCKSANAGGLV